MTPDNITDCKELTLF